MTKKIKIQKKSKKNNPSEKGKLDKFLIFITNGITPYLIIVAIIFGVYIQILSYGLTNLDDEKILHNANSITIKNDILEAFYTDAMLSHRSDEFYRPMQGLSFIIDAKIGNDNPFTFHLTNLLLHLLNSCILFYILLLLKCDKKISLFLILIFSIHPLFNQAVIWLPSRGDLLVTMFSLISFISFIKFSESKNYIFYLFNITTFAFAVFSKEIAVLLPAIFLLYYYLKVKNKRNIFNINNITLTISWFVIIVIYLIIRSNIVKSILNSDQFGIKPFIHNLPVIPEFLSKFFLPFNLSVLPEYNIATVLIGLLILTAGLYYIIKNNNKLGDFTILFVGWFILLTVTAMFYRHEHLKNGYDYLEHRAYLPLMAVIMFLASFRFNQQNVKRYMIIILTFFVIFTGITISRVSIFRSPESFYTSAIDKGTKVALAYNNRGNYWYNIHNLKVAIQDFNRAIDIKPDYSNAFNNLGVIKNDIGDFRNAIQDFNQAIIFKSDYAEAFNNRGVAKYNSGDITAAKQDYDFAVKYKPDYAEAYNNLGVAKSDLGDNIGALKDYSRAIELKSDYAEAYNNRGLSNSDLGDYINAKYDYTRAIEIRPNNFFACNNLGRCLINLKEYNKAIPYFEKAIQINPKFADAWKNLGISKQRINDLNGAGQAWKKAAELGNKECKDLLELLSK